MKKLLIGLFVLGSYSSFAQELNTTTIELIDYHTRDVVASSTTVEGRSNIEKVFKHREKLQMCADQIVMLNEVKDAKVSETLRMIEEYASGKPLSEYTKWLIEKDTKNLKTQAKVQIYVLGSSYTVKRFEDYTGVESYLRVGSHSNYLGKANYRGCDSLVGSFELELNTIYSLIVDSIDKDQVDYNLPGGIN